MREHQIVITLKPEQFAEIQRLSRLANAKSMGVFVRQQLLAALGLEPGDGEGEAKAPIKRNLEPAMTELKRLHYELKGFVAETLTYSFPLGEGLETPPVSSGSEAVASVVDDELERIAGKTFAISPRLGAVEEEERKIRDPLEELLGDENFVPKPPVPPSVNGGYDDFEDDEELDEYFTSLAQRSQALRSQDEEPLPDIDDAVSEEDVNAGAPDPWLEQTVMRSSSTSAPTTVQSDSISQEPEPDLNAAYSQREDADDSGQGNSQGGFPLSGGPPPKRRKV